MPSITKLTRLARLSTLPETRRAVIAAARSDDLRDLAHRATTDRQGLVRDLRDPANARELLRAALRHPAGRELGSVSLMLLPGRYLPVGWAVTWAGSKIARRYIDRPTEVLDPTTFGARSHRRNVTPDPPSS
jgi:hypothetical protein